MPLVWRLFLLDYVKVLCLSMAVFLVLLLAMRLEELAQFASLGASSYYLLSFIWYQIPFIFPIALPLSALISSLLLMRRFSETGELIALRALGFSLWDIATPLLLMASFLALLNFFMLSEVATQADRMKRTLKKELQALNPLIVLQNEKLTQLKGIYTRALGHVEGNNHVRDLLLCVHHQSKHCLILLIAKELKATDAMLVGQDVTLWTPISDSNARLIVENTAFLELPKPNFPELFKGPTTKLGHEHAPVAELLRKLFSAPPQKIEAEVTPTKGQNIERARLINELVRRFALGFSVWSFTLLGVAYGLQLQRTSSNRSLITVAILTTLYICSVLFAKKAASHSSLVMLAYLLPQMLMIACSVTTLRRIEKGL